MSQNKLFLQKGGEMGALTRIYNWSSTAIGDIETWSQSHLTAVNIMLTSRFPMLVFWGEELITFYNDAFRPSLGNDGKHPGSLGQPGHQSWAESWPVIGPMIHTIMQGGEAVYFEDQKLPLYREGKMGYAYWTYSFSPLLDDDGSVGGVLVTCSETTKAVESTIKLAQSESRFQNLVREASIGIVVLLGENWNIAVANDSFAKLIGHKLTEITGKNLFDVLPEAKDEFDQVMRTVYKEGKSVTTHNVPYASKNEKGETIDSYVNIVYQPYREEDGTVTGIIEIIQDVTDKVLADKNAALIHEKEQALYKDIAESEERFRVMAEASPILIAVGDESGKATYFNESWAKLTGRANEELMAMGWIDLIHAEDVERVVKTYREAFEAKVPWEWEFRMPDQNGNYRWLLARGTPRFRSDHSFAGYISATIDIDERKKEEQRKNDFIGMVSHELKSPLTSLNGFLHILNLKTSRFQDEQISALIQKSKKQSDKILAIITGFLDVVRLGESQIKLNRRPFDMAHLVKDAEQDSLERITSHRIIYHPVEFTPVVADKDKIEQVLINFINNAVKYAPEGSEINVTCITEGDWAYSSVLDQGMGISENDQKHIFDRFFRVDSNAMDKITGFGIGLYICKEIIERHGGQIGVESQIGRGSKFWFKLPIEETNEVNT